MEIGWREIHEAMAHVEAEASVQHADILQAVQALDAFTQRIVDRDMGIADAPAAYVAASLSTRAFRLGVSSAHLVLSGYPDSGPNLLRTILEIAIRLAVMIPSPEAAAYGFLLHAHTREAESLVGELSYREQHGLEGGFLQRNLDTIRSTHLRITEVVQRRGHDPVELEHRFGKINMRAACRDLGIEKAYLVDYAYASGFVHERLLAESDYAVDRPGIREHELGPIPHQRGTAAALLDCVQYTALALNQGSLVIRDERLAQDTARFMDEFRAAHAKWWTTAERSARE